MKKRFPSFLAGAASALLLTALCSTALAASGRITYNFVNVSLDGETKIAAGESITAANGQQVPGSLLYTDEAGGKTNYLPIRAISELLGVEIGYDSAGKTVLLQSAAQAVPRWTVALEEGRLTFRSKDGGVKHDTPPAFRPARQAQGWGLAELRGGRSSVTWSFQNGDARLDFRCAYPGGSIGYGMFQDPEKAVENRRQLTIQGHAASLYTEGDDSLLAWEDSTGLLFCLTGRNADPEALIQAAESIQSCGEETVCEAAWLPEGAAPFERTIAGDTVQEVWMVDGSSMTLLASPCPIASQEGQAEAVKVNGQAGRFWAAREPAEAREVRQETLGGVIITSATVSGFGAADMNTLTWSDPERGVNFCLLSALDKATMIRIAEHTAP